MFMVIQRRSFMTGMLGRCMIIESLVVQIAIANNDPIIDTSQVLHMQSPQSQTLARRNPSPSHRMLSGNLA